MENKLTEHQTGALVETLDQKGIGEMLRPLIREIHLMDSFVAGTTHLGDKSVLSEISIGDQLSLVREDNPFDEYAIVLLTQSGKKVGYVPQKDNLVFARLMDAGKALTARITGIEKRRGFHQISIGIFLVDF